MFDRENINLDELVRNKLSNESDVFGRSQAWEKMSAMLDENQDRPKVLPFWKNRWVIPASILLLTSVVSIGYWLDRDDNSLQIEANSKNLVATSTPTDHAITESNTLSPQIVEGNQSTSDDVQSSFVASIGDSNRTTKATQRNQKIAKNHQTSSSYPSPVGNIANNTIPAKHKKVNIDQSGNIQNESKIAKQSLMERNSDIDNVVKNNIVSNNNKQFSKREIENSKEDLLELAKKGNLIINKDANNAIQKIDKSYPKVSVVNETVHLANENSYSSFDTVRMGRMERIKYVPLSSLEIAAIQELDVFVPQDYAENMMPVRLNEKISLADVQDQTASLASKTDEIISDSKTTISEKGKAEILLADLNNFFEIRNKFYLNVLGGFNTTPKNAFPFGINAGIGIHYWVGKKFTLGTELGYSLRPINYTLVDESKEITLLGSGTPVAAGTLYNYNEKKTTKQYQFNYIQGLDIPLLFTYHANNFSLYGGPMLSTLLPLRYQKTELVTSDDKMIVLSNGEGFNYESTSLASQPVDFNSRIGLGAMLGFNYQINKNLGVSVRYSQIFTDNARSYIGQNLSKNMFHLPSFRVGLVYKFGKANSVQYMMSPK